MRYGALEAGGTKMVLSRLDENGTMLERVSMPTEHPDVTLPAEERQIGGLGIYMVKKSMDGMEYEYRNGQNILTIRKLL